MTYKEIMKSADNETVKQRVKAIYPHIVVSGDVDKPYYSIHWYDIEKEEMYCGFSSFKLELVRKWLKEEFEVVEADIDDLINRQKAELSRAKDYIELLEIEKQALKEDSDKSKATAMGVIKRQDAEIERLQELVDEMGDYFPACINCEGKTTIGERTDACVYLIDTTNYCTKRGMHNIVAIQNENRELKAEIKTAKAEAVKEFAERLKAELEIEDNEDWFEITEHGLVSEIDNLVKEMVGAESG